MRSKGWIDVLRETPTDKERLRLDEKVQDVIVSLVEDRVLSHLISCKTASEMWKKLTSLFEPKSSIGKYLLQKEFFDYEFQAKGLGMHISDLENIVAKLKAQDDEISETMLMTKIISSLPPEYAHFVTAWESVVEKEHALHNLTSRLLLEESRLTENNSNKEKLDNVALPSHRTYNPKARSSNKRFPCHFCDKIGHFIAQCPARLQKEKEKRKESSIHRFEYGGGSTK
ncbi:uncharacterized protein LOC111613247 [Centruroides sculpturatus]|uniref:uncharacterized protein LOC111613247 n=1 Tax=Centruroides sculpturatus TaxID=218467 RepID=UPI000C6C9766|nr:uncharacterized protein LOC111613247 [Centruroides sculpturatus]